MLVKSKNLPPYLQDVYVEGINTQIHDGSDSSEEDSSRTGGEDNDDEEQDSDKESRPRRIRELKIRVYNHTVEFKKNRRVVVSAGWTFSICFLSFSLLFVCAKSYIKVCHIHLKELRWVWFLVWGFHGHVLHGALLHGFN